MFYIILFALIISGFLTAIKFPNLTSKLTSFLPTIRFSKFFSNPKIKTLLRDREYFADNVSKLLRDSLFIVLGYESYKIYNFMAPKDAQGIQKKLESSENPFELIKLYDTNFLFVNPTLLSAAEGKTFNSRLQYLISKICKIRRQKYLDGILIVPNSSVYQKGDLPPTKEMLSEINSCTHMFDRFDRFFRVRIPLYFLAHSESVSNKRVFKNIFRHDPSNANNDIFLGFSCDVMNRKPKEKIYQFFQDSVRKFVKSFDAKSAQIMQLSPHDGPGLNIAHAIYRVKTEIFSLSDKYLSHFFDFFEKNTHIELSSLNILNSILFASSEGSDSQNAIENLFAYLANDRKDLIVFSNRFINRRTRYNLILGISTLLFATAGSLTFILLNNHILNKKEAYIQKSIVKYDKFAQQFNEIVSNRYPFAPLSMAQNIDLEALYRVFDEFQKITSGSQGYFYLNIEKLTNRADIQNFAHNFQDVVYLLQPQRDEKGVIVGAFNLGVKFKFRTPRSNEILANRIINWAISTGRFAYGSAYGDYWQTIFPWSYGDSFVLTLDLPKTSDAHFEKNLAPVIGEISQKHIKTTQDSVQYSYQRDVWSLFRFIENYNLCQSIEVACDRGLLKFDIPLQDKTSILFYSTIELYNKNGDLLRIPFFPQKAPYFKP